VDRLTTFRAQGFTVPGGVDVAVLTQAASASAAPAGLMAAVAHAGLAAGATAGAGISFLLLVSLMNLSNLQTASVCALLLATPLAWQWNQRRELRAREFEMLSALASATQEWDDAQSISRPLRTNLIRAQSDALNARNRFAAATCAGGPTSIRGMTGRPLPGFPRRS